MAIVNVNGISGINSITAQSGSLNFYTAAGNNLPISAGTLNVGTGASVSSPATNVLVLGTNNAERVRVDSSGNIGLGTNTVLSTYRIELDSASSSSSANLITLTARNTSSQAKRFYVQASGLDSTPLYTFATGAVGIDPAIAFAPTGIEALRITSSGGIGIGTTTTNSRLLSITGAGNAGTQVEIRGSSDAAGIAMFSARQFEIQSTASNEANYPSSFIVYDRNANGYRMAIDGSGRLRIPSQPSFLVYGNTDQTITSANSYVKTTLWTVSHNTGSNWSSNRFTAPVAGKYLFGVNLRIDTINSDYSRIIIGKNGSTNLNQNGHAITRFEAYGNNYHTNVATILFDMAVNDYVEVYAYASTDTNFQVQSESQWWGHLLG